MTDQQDLRARLLALPDQVQAMATKVDVVVRLQRAEQIAEQLREAAAQLPAGVPDGWDFRRSGVEAFVRGPDGSGGWFKRAGTLWQRTLFDLVEAMIAAAPQPDSKESR